MSDERRSGNWHVSWSRDEPSKVLDEANNLIATVAGEPERRALARAGLIAATPALYDAVEAALIVFRAMAAHGDEKFAAVGAEMIPAMESALEGANFLGEITPEVLSGG